MKPVTKSYIYGITAILLWSTAASAFKIALRYIDYVQLLLYAGTISTIVLFLILVFQRKVGTIFSFSRNYYLRSAGVGLLNPFLYYMVLLKAYTLLPAQIAQPLNYTWPLMLVLLSIPLLGQKLQGRSLIAILVSFSGVFFISSQGNLSEFRIENPLGVLLATGSSIVWALFWIFNVKDKRDEVVKLFLNFVFGSLYTFIIALFISDPFPANIDYRGVLAATYVGFFELSITFTLWLKALQLATSNVRISNLVYISPFVSLILIHFIIGESIYPTTIMGLMLIILGIGIQQLGGWSKTKMQKT